jgi:hypothetical protein
MICLCAALCLLAGAAQAQMGGMGGMGGMGRAGRGMGGGGGSTQGGADCRPAPETNSAAQVNFRLSQLQDALHLRAEQMATWQSFAAKVRALTEDVAREQGRSMDLRPGADSGPLPGLKHVSRAVEAARSRMTALEEIEATSTALYKTFTPEQKTLADARVPEIVAPRPLAPVGSVN